MAIVLQAEYDKGADVIIVSVQIEDSENVYTERMTSERFCEFRRMIDRGFVIVSDLTISLNNLSKRTRRGIIQYFDQF